MNGKERLRLLALADVAPRQVRWLVPGLIPRGTLTLVAGVGGLGKSTWLADIAAEVSRGSLGDDPADVLLVSFEDTAAEALRPRVEAARGDLGRVHTVVVGELGIDAVQLPADVVAVERLVREVGARLVVIDPIVAAIDVALDAHRDQDVRHVLAQLAALAERASCAVVLVAHLNKTPSRDAYIRIGGSVGFWNAARSVVLIAEDPDDPETQRLIAQRKANYSRLRPVERWRIEEVTLPTLDPETGEPITTSRMTFVEVANEVDGADLLAPREPGDDRPGEGGALRFLLAALGDGNWHPSTDLKLAAADAGISERTLERAKRDLAIEHRRSGFPSATQWRLPVAPSSSPATWRNCDSVRRRRRDRDPRRTAARSRRLPVADRLAQARS